MKQFINRALTAFAIIFAIPSFLILISWNALPGDTLYGVKTSLEDVALALTIKTPLASIFSVNFTQRRFNEANRLLAKSGSTLGYSLLVAEASQSRDIIIDQADVRQARELVAKIEAYQKTIDEKKQVLRTQPTAILPSTTPSSLKAPTYVTPTSSVSSPIPTLTVSPLATTPTTSVVVTPTPTTSQETPPVDDIIDDLDQTSEELEEIKDEINRQLPQQASEQAIQQQEERDKREDEKKDNSDKNKNER
jgi:hypothetical protein